MLNALFFCLPRIQLQIIIDQAWVVPLNLGHFQFKEFFSFNLDLMFFYAANMERYLNGLLFNNI